ncbi:phospholipase D/nuclease [Thozetella sp. PMI_491]|nr:phospholipase D/nuclease [Thozetella sp. PMI_491]
MADDRASEFNGGDDEDEALRVAIAMSLGQDPSKGQEKASAIDLTKDDSSDGTKVSATVPEEAPLSKMVGAETTASAAPRSAFSLLGLDRKGMEAERLARLKKRKAQGLDGAADGAPRQRQKPNESAQAASAAPVLKPTMPARPSREDRRAVEASSTRATSVNSNLKFPRGVVKKTWAFGQARLGDDIKIEEVLQKDQLELAVLSSFQWDDAWLMSKVDLGRTKLILVAFASDEIQKEAMRSNVPSDKIRFCFPPMHGSGAMHSKLQLLKFADYLRIAVPTGNLVPYDWGESGTMENMVFLIDLPKIEDAEQRAASKLTAFGEDLCYFLSAQGLDEKLIGSLGNYDFSETSGYAFVHSIAGSHQSEDAWRRIGYCGLGRAVQGLGLGTRGPVQIDFVCSSVGSANEGLVTALYNACQGDSGLKEYQYRAAKPKARNLAGGADSGWEEIQDRFRVYFPSRATVVQSKGGTNGAGTICFQSKWWKAPTFPHRILRDCKSVRAGLLMHSKVLFVRHPEPTQGDGRTFAYVGSANFSESAWGRLSQDRGTKKPKLTCRNWECGVLVQTVQCEANGATSSISTLASSSAFSAPSDGNVGGDAESLATAFQGCIPVPMQLPSAAYPLPIAAAPISTAPWFFMGNG